MKCLGLFDQIDRYASTLKNLFGVFVTFARRSNRVVMREIDLVRIAKGKRQGGLGFGLGQAFLNKSVEDGSEGSYHRRVGIGGKRRSESFVGGAVNPSPHGDESFLSIQKTICVGVRCIKFVAGKLELKASIGIGCGHFGEISTNGSEGHR